MTGLSLHCFIEGNRYRAEELARAVVPLSDENDAFDASQVVALLRDMSVGKTPVLEPAGNNGSSVQDSAEYRFNYVGMLSVANRLFLVFPKYYRPFRAGSIDDKTVADTMESILKAIGRYNSDSKHNDLATGYEYDFEDDGIDNQLELFSFLLNDYADNGLYQSSAHIHELNGAGEINWERTIDRYVPYSVGNDGDAAYIDYDSERNVRSNETIIRRIHAATITSISRYLEQSRLNRILGFPLAEPCDESPHDIGDTDTLLRLLRRELVSQFATRKRLLIRSLIRYVERDGNSQCTVLLAQGTCSFHLVWEDICKRLFADDEGLHHIAPTTWLFDDPVDWDGSCKPITQRLPDSGQNTGTAAHAPWRYATDSDADPEDMLPDVVSRTADGGIVILDAKYYVPRYSHSEEHRTTVTHAPSAKDVMKQYFYYFGLANGFDDRNTADAAAPAIHGNAFIMPAQVSPGSAHAEGERSMPSRRLIAQRGVVYMPFMPGVMKRLYGSTVGGSVPVFEMQPEPAIRLYIDEAIDCNAFARKSLKRMFG